MNSHLDQVLMKSIGYIYVYGFLCWKIYLPLVQDLSQMSHLEYHHHRVFDQVLKQNNRSQWFQLIHIFEKKLYCFTNIFQYLLLHFVLVHKLVLMRGRYLQRRRKQQCPCSTRPHVSDQYFVDLVCLIENRNKLFKFFLFTVVVVEVFQYQQQVVAERTFFRTKTTRHQYQIGSHV